MQTPAKPAGPCTIVIFGAAGDLTKRLLVPALYNLRCEKLLPEEFAVVGIARSRQEDETFRRELETSLRKFAQSKVDEGDLSWLAERTSYVQGDFDDPATYKRLAEHLTKIDQTNRTAGNYLFYLATPPQVFATIVQRLGEAGVAAEAEGHWRRIIVEKPFGTDLRSAQELNRKILAVVTESQIYRIDHYLGKETVQNIMVFRFGNGIFEPLWNRNHIDHVQITVAEAVGVEGRGKFYEGTGALRDMVPNHLFQLLTLVAMEPPTCFAAEAVRSEKAKVLEAAQPFSPQDAQQNVVRGQYGGGRVNGRTVDPYRCAPNVAPDSNTETFVALKLKMDNWRWAGVPIYLRTGKALAKRRSEIVIQFKQAPLALFRDTPVERLTRNDLVLHIQPEEGVTLRFGAKVPGPEMQMGGVEMKFDYHDYFQAQPRTGYETLIYDCMNGDATLFKRADDIETGWRIVQPVLDAWQAEAGTEPPIYPAGSSGPQEADALLARDGRHWRSLDASAGGKSS
ncbi:MAG TPA: glucose-6-phosphate dehydrogenase [Xanthobacteraceae bacterium]|nr:glucose-6-phosphate dehydrogenase [Xanthobacteraceae bacterium]